MRFLFIGLIALFLDGSTLRAQKTPGDEFIRIYANLERADREKADQNLTASRELYSESLSDLQEMQTMFPEWKPKVITYRIRYAQQMLKQVESELEEIQKLAFDSAQAQETDPEILAQQQETEALKSNVERLIREKQLLEAQLREAFAARPAAVEPDRLRIAESTIRSLEAELEATRMRLKKQNETADPEVEESSSEQTDSTRGAAENENNSENPEELENLRARLEVLEGIEKEWKERQAYLEGRIQTLTVEWQAAKNNEERLLAQLKIVDEQPIIKPDNDSGLVALQQKYSAVEEELKTVKAQLQQKDSLIQSLRDDLESEKDRPEVISPSPGSEARVDEEINRLKARLAVFEAEKVPYTEEELKLFSVPQPNDPIFKLNSNKAGDKLVGNTAPSSKVNQRTLLDIEMGRRDLDGGNEEGAKQALRRIALRELKWITVAESGMMISRTEDSGSFKRRSKKIWSAVTDNDLRRFGELFTEARIQMREAKYDEAINTYQELLEIREDPFIWKDLSMAYWSLERYELAESAARKGLALQPDHPMSFYALGLIRMNQERPEAAIDYFSQAVRGDPEFSAAYVELGRSLFIAGYRLAGENSLRKAILIDPGSPAAHSNLAAVYIDQDPPLAALANYHYQKSLDLGGPQNLVLENRIEMELSTD